MNDSNHSPGKLLAFFYLSPAASLVLLSGPSGCGKTNWCLQLNRVAAQQKLLAQGLISPPIFDAGLKIGIDLLPLPDGCPRRLAIRHQGDTIGLLTDYWHFDKRQLIWGQRHLASLRNPELLIIDELGPLEFLHGQGWQSAFQLVEKRTYRMAIVVVRPSLLGLAKARWPWAETLLLPPRAAEKEAWLEHNDLG